MAQQHCRLGSSCSTNSSKAHSSSRHSSSCHHTRLLRMAFTKGINRYVKVTHPGSMRLVTHSYRISNACVLLLCKSCTSLVHMP